MSKLSVKVIKEVEADFKKCYVSDIKSHNKNMEKVLKNFDGYLQYCLEKCQKFEWFIIKLRIRAEDFSDFLNEAQRLGFTLIKNEQDRDIAIMYNSAYEKGRKEKSLICKQVKKFNSDLKKRRKKVKSEIRNICDAINKRIESGDFISYFEGLQSIKLKVNLECHELNHYEEKIIKKYFKKINIKFNSKEVDSFNFELYF